MELCNDGLKIFHGMTNHLVTGMGSKWQQDNQLITWELKFLELKDIVLLTINPIFNHALKVKERPERDRRIDKYSSTNSLLVNHMEVVANARYAEARAAPDEWFGWIAAALRLGSLAAEVVSLSKTGRY